ncbi:10881_t:CDS:2 [Racocetra fulgida]|uniref:10881_t:CDS:1 n=1 Tax=Racocetra fulgida TaxID=60492 RepID=A0A9N8VJD4_9GLOM|nr:10881_t:CDS:2 [Racocetra fulgida]
MFLVLFRFYFNSSIKKNEREKKDCQQSEKTQLRNFLASANHSSPSPSLENIFFLLDSNSTQLFLHFFNSVLFRLPNLLIPGLNKKLCIEIGKRKKLETSLERSKQTTNLVIQVQSDLNQLKDKQEKQEEKIGEKRQLTKEEKQLAEIQARERNIFNHTKPQN